MADSKITALTANTTPLTTDILPMVDDPAGTPATQKITIANLLQASTFPAGAVVQVVYTNSTAVATGTTTVPMDDTIPQITEGTEFMTLAITPKSTTNVLDIHIVALVANSTAGVYNIGALFQDATANALAGNISYSTNGITTIITINYTMVAGTTSATTFRFRAGPSAAGTITFNGVGGSRYLGAITKSSIVIYEHKA